MLDKPSTCQGCPLYERGTGFSRPDPKCTGSNGVLLLGEALGAREAEAGIPFVGEAGYQLEKTLWRTKYKREDFQIWNVVACRPPNNWLEGAPWEAGAIAHCSQYLEKVIHWMKPNVIVPMGNVALRAILQKWGIESYRGYVYETSIHNHKCHVVPTYHPSFLLRGAANLTGVQIFDLRRAVGVAGSRHEPPKVTYIEHPTEATLKEFKKEAGSAVASGGRLAADIETPRSRAAVEDEFGKILDVDIECISFAFRPHYAITVPWKNEFLQWIESMLTMGWEYLVWWNANFDVPRIKAKGVRMIDRHLDAMEAWRWCQSDVPHGLGYAATFFTNMPEWKSLSSTHPTFYSCCDPDATIQCLLGIEKLLRREGRWEPFIRHVVEVDPYLKIMGDAGVTVDLQAREEFDRTLREEIDDINRQIQGIIPVEVCPFKPRRKVPGEAVLGADVRADGKSRWDYDRQSGEWGERGNFSYRSPKHIVRYMRFRGHPVPKHYKTGEDTTEKKEIERLVKKYSKDPLYPLVLEAKARSTLKSVYIDGQQPGPDSKMRTHLGFATSTGRLNAWDENVMNQPKHSELCKPYRKQFVPAKGCVLAEFDYKAMQAVAIGWLAKDEAFIKASKLGVHAIMASHVLTKNGVLKQPLDVIANGEVQEKIKLIKEMHESVYDDCKHLIYGSLFLGTPWKLHLEYPKSFPTKQIAEDLQNMLWDTIGKGVRQWHVDTLDTLQERSFIVSPFGQAFYFWDVYTKVNKRRDRKWDIISKKYGPMNYGLQAKDAMACLPQHIERCTLTEAIKRIFSRGMGQYVRWPIHDSLLCSDIPKEAAGDVIPLIKEEMERPVPELDGLKFGVDVKWSEVSWAEGDMEEWR